MKELPPLGSRGLTLAALVLLLATATRVGYLATCCDFGHGMPRLFVQDTPPEQDSVVENLREHHWFGTLAPLAREPEATSHVAPGYPWLISWFTSDADIRRLQTGLSILTVLLLFLHARHAFASNFAAFCVGLLAAFEPFWIISLGDIADGTLVTFLLAAVLFLGSHAARTGGPLASVLFGLSLAGMCLVRASLLPLAFVTLAWFLVRCRGQRLGWFAGLLALLGFGNGLAPWTARNWHLFHDPVPVVSSAYLHLWIGSMPGATGGPVDSKALLASLPPERLQDLLDESNQARRYSRLSHDLAQRLRDDPGAVARLRLSAAIAFVVGDAWRHEPALAVTRDAAETTTLPPEVERWAETATALGLMLLLVLAFFGWRGSARCGGDCRLASYALLWPAIPFILSHAELHSGPRLPWDVALVLFAGYALARLLPAQRAKPAAPVRKPVPGLPARRA